MPVTTTNGAGGKLRTYEGTAQEVLNAAEAHAQDRRLAFGRDGAGAWYAVVRL